MFGTKRSIHLLEALPYSVDDSFLRITPASFIGEVLPAGIIEGVIQFEYSVNLSGLKSRLLQRLTQVA
jgi:hypothetical protein